MRTWFLLSASFVMCQSASEGADCLPRPRLTLSRQTQEVVRLDLTGSPGINYAIEKLDALSGWTRIATNRSASGVMTFSYPVSWADPLTVFRAVTTMSADGLGGAFIFNGNTFAGWEGDTISTFRIAQCAIVGGSLTQRPAENRFLCTTRRYTNFILRLEFKLLGTNGFINSGVQYRSERVAGSQQVVGYQADLGDGYWGSLYDESRRDVVLAAANQAAVGAVLRRGDWNTYMIHAEGARMRFWINGYQTIDYTEASAGIPRYGIIGLQVHAGGYSEASFRNISVEVLP